MPAQMPPATRVNGTIEHARAIMASWPAWKRNILVHSGQPSVTVPRKPVVNR